MLGVHEDVRARLSIGFRRAGCSVVLLGRSEAEFGGSLWAHVAHRHLGGCPPAVDLEAERRLADVLAIPRVKNVMTRLSRATRILRAARAFF